MNNTKHHVIANEVKQSINISRLFSTMDHHADTKMLSSARDDMTVLSKAEI